MRHLIPALLLSATPAYAEVTPQDVLDSWRTFYAGLGASITVENTEISGGTTRLNNLFVRMEQGNIETNYLAEWIDLRDNADGSVDITFSENIASRVVSSFADGTTALGLGEYDLSALRIKATGTPDNITFRYDAPVLALEILETSPGFSATIKIEIADMSGEATSRRLAGDVTTVSDTGALEFGAVSALVSLLNPGSESPVVFDIASAGSSISYQIDFPQKPIPDASVAGPLFPPDMNFQMSLLLGPLTLVAEQKAKNNDTRVELSQQSAEISTSYLANILAYGFTSNDVLVSVANTAPGRPDFSLGFAAANIGAGFPVLKSEAPQPFSISLGLSGLTLGERLWAMLDPNASLGQTPASFALAISGTVKPLIDLFDETAMAELRGPPFEISALSLDSFSLDIEGMAVNGNGALTFSPERIDAATRLPMPEGLLEFSLTGALGLLDKIGQLGIADPMMVLGAKGALGMFASPENAPDSFSTIIEFEENGRITANGVALQ